MSLPPAFSDEVEYFEECMKFLTRYRDLYWKSNTDVLTDDLNFHVQLHESDNKTDIEGDIDLSVFSDAFFKDLKRLAPCYENFEDKNTLNSVQTPMSQKKAHEVAYLAEEIKNMCAAVDCETVVDLGAGLGYIDLQLFVKTGFNVLGLEGKESFYVNAKEHQRKYHSESLSKVKYIRHVISENSDTNIATYLKDKFPDNNGFCFMGLHACGDLTVSAINLFIKMRNSRALVVTPCCYHKMADKADNGRRFKNFPLSETLKRIFEKFEMGEFLDIPFLRVAAQPAYIRDEDIHDRVFYLLARALLKVYAKKYNCRVQKIRRKAVRHHLVKKDFARYAEEATTKGFKLVPISDPGPGNKNTENRNISVEFNLKELQSMWEKIPKTTFTNAALYISFQNHLPPIFENLILYDRIVYLKESGINDCYVRKVVDEKISPKCLSLFARKENILPS